MLRGFIVIAVFTAATGHASELRQVTYEYAPSAAVWSPMPAHVICDDCPPVKRVQAIPVKVKLTNLRVKSVAVDSEEDSTEAIQTADTKVVVTFDLDSARLTDEAKQDLGNSVSTWNKAGKLNVTGYTCDIGTKEHNDVLARKRAEAVADYLASQGIDRAGMTVEGKGKCCYTGISRKADRRVEVKPAREAAE